MKDKLYPCPCEPAGKCALTLPCLGCETYSIWLAEHPKPPDKPKEWEKQLNKLNDNNIIPGSTHNVINNNAEGIERLTERVKANENDMLTREGVEQTLFDKIAELEKQIKVLQNGEGVV